MQPNLRKISAAKSKLAEQSELNKKAMVTFSFPEN